MGNNHFQKKPKILHVIDQTGEGGAQVAIQNILKALKDEFSFSVAVLGSSGQFSGAYEALGIPVFNLGNERSRWDPSPLIGLIQTSQREKYDLVHTHLFKSNILGTMAARWIGCRTILHDHSSIDPQSMKCFIPNVLSRQLYLMSYQFAIHTCDRVIVLTPNARRHYIGSYSIDPQKVTILPEPVDVVRINQTKAFHYESVRKELRVSDNTKLVMMVARLEPQKDWCTFLQVAQRVIQEASEPCAFIAVGSGAEEHSLRNYAKSQGLSRVFFLGHREDVPQLLRQVDVFLLTSRFEPFGMVVLEAMAAGCPVIATRSGGPEAILTHESDGLLANVEDVDSLTKHVLCLLKDEDLSKRLTRRALTTALGGYNLDTTASCLAQIYTDVVGG